MSAAVMELMAGHLFREKRQEPAEAGEAAFRGVVGSRTPLQLNLPQPRPAAAIAEATPLRVALPRAAHLLLRPIDLMRLVTLPGRVRIALGTMLVRLHKPRRRSLHQRPRTRRDSQV